MSNEQPEALRLAERFETRCAIDSVDIVSAAAELRRLHAVEVERDQLRAASSSIDWMSTLGFALEVRSGVHVVVEDDDSCRPASLAERVLWNALMDSARQVPKEATSEMQHAYAECLRIGSELDGSMVWRAMLAAARKGRA